MDSLIYDRTLQDIMTVINKPNDTKFLKGAFNYVDLNRIESYCKFIQDLANEVCILDEKISIETKTTWEMTDFINLNDLNRIRNNVTILMGKLNVIGEQIEFSNTFDYIQANIIEKNLFILKEVFKKFNKEIYICGTFYCGSYGLYAERSV